MKVIKKIIFISLIFLFVNIPYVTDASELKVNSQFTYEGQITTNKPTPPTNFPDDIKSGLSSLIQGKLPTTGEIQLLGISLVGIIILLLLGVIYYHFRKRTVGGWIK